VRVLLSLSGLEGRSFVSQAFDLLPPNELDVVLLYVIDTRPAEELGYVRRSLLRRPPYARDAEVGRVESDAADEVIAEARERCLELGASAGLLKGLVRRGHPQHEIVRAAADEMVQLVVVGARHHGAAVIGPKSVGPVARFVLDHAPCDVLLLRRQPV